ncbi:MAG TPA: uracil phosphoribosyltransferase [Pseudolabrys sp.]|jgi:uracil phosphoribosyltransferase|uniref:uracil phosphoribosyltransferase n=1 Tax=Pseudolabrys sp. TaxID=1960880 RepID=UPI002DDC92C9|nr:uracil phosphoribosyltransferase [Pseudolabrys sp.]HEV2628321.1 uracil phosphoribosyltransferase [Pseudolabrys sp.]
MQGVTVIDHPLIQHKLTLLRDKTRSTKVFRELFNEIGTLLCYEVTRDLPLEMRDIETPLASMQSPVLAGKKLVLAPVGRAGNGFLDGMLNLLPSARVAHVGVYRDPRTLVAVEYFFKAPDDMAERLTLVLHPMLATGNSAVAAVDRLKETGAKAIRVVCLLATPQAIENVRGHHPDVRIWTAAIDQEISETGYIRPGLGDVGDRMYGTR